MPAFRGKTLWFSALALWLTATPADAVDAADPLDGDDKAWAYEVVHAHVLQTKAWSPADYRLIAGPGDADHFAVTVWHKDDIELTRTGIAPGGKSFEISLSRRTRGILSERYFR